MPFGLPGAGFMKKFNPKNIHKAAKSVIGKVTPGGMKKKALATAGSSKANPSGQPKGAPKLFGKKMSNA